MRKYHSFRDYYLECCREGRMVEKTCKECGTVHLMCKPFGGQCSSKKCKGLRWPQVDNEAG